MPQPENAEECLYCLNRAQDSEFPEVERLLDVACSDKELSGFSQTSDHPPKTLRLPTGKIYVFLLAALSTAHGTFGYSGLGGALIGFALLGFFIDVVFGAIDHSKKDLLSATSAVFFKWFGLVLLGSVVLFVFRLLSGVAGR